MGEAANRAKARWNATNYAQVKVSVDPEIAAAFKAACAAGGVSMAGVLSQFMSEYGGAAARVREPAIPGSLSTRRKRRKATAEVASRLEMILEAETASHENVPENLRGAEAYETTEDIISALDEAIRLLGCIY